MTDDSPNFVKWRLRQLRTAQSSDLEWFLATPGQVVREVKGSADVAIDRRRLTGAGSATVA